MVLADNDPAILDGKQERDISIDGKLAHRLQINSKNLERLVLLADINLVLVAAEACDRSSRRQLLREHSRESADIENRDLVLSRGHVHAILMQYHNVYLVRLIRDVNTHCHRRLVFEQPHLLYGTLVVHNPLCVYLLLHGFL